jgi:CHAT domain-containing protein
VFADVKDASESEKYLKRAEKTFKELRVAQGEIQVSLKRVSILSLKTTEEVQKLLELADAFKTIDYPVGQVTALAAARSAALDLYPQQDFLNIHGLIEEVFARTGNQYLGLKQNIAFHSVLILWPEHIGKAIEGLRQYIDSASDETPHTKGRLAMFLGQAYAFVGDWENSLKFSKLAVDCLKQGCKYETLSDATLLQANAMTFGEVGVDYVAAIKLLEDSLRLDEKHKYLSGQAKKCESLASLEGLLALKSGDVHHKWKEEYWAAKRESIKIEASRFAATDSIRLCLSKKDFAKAMKLARAALEKYSMEQDLMQVAQCHQMLFSCYYRPFDFSCHPRTQSVKVDQILNQARTAIAAYENLGPHRTPVEFLIEISMAFEELGRYSMDRKSELYHETLKYLEVAETTCERMRKDLSPSSGLASLLQKRILVSYRWHQEIYTRAQRIALAVGDAQQVWFWTQKAKARALSDMVASQLISRGQLRIMTAEGHEAGNLLREEAQLMKALQSATRFEGTSLRRKLDDLRAKEDYSALGPILGSMTGKLEPQDLGWLFESSVAMHLPANAKIVLVDWLAVGDVIVMLTMDESLVPQLCPLEVTLSQVILWKRRNMAQKKPLSEDEHLIERNKLNGLVSELETCTAKEDLLVLCPSAALHGLPFHALKVGSTNLIDRNLVIYTQSLTLLRQCYERANDRRKGRSGNLRGEFMAVYEDEACKDETEKIFDCVTNIAASFNSQPKLGVDANRKNFAKIAGDTDILHYHGHMAYHPNVLCQALVLSEGGTFPDQGGKQGLQNSVSEARRHHDYFTVHDAFSLRINASLATIIACGSVVQDIAPGDEPLGLLSALLYAGTSTIVSTLWPVDSADGRRFASVFFKNLRSQLNKDASLSPVNLAVAFREAIKRIRKVKDKHLLYHWAGFVMHGAWFL